MDRAAVVPAATAAAAIATADIVVGVAGGAGLQVTPARKTPSEKALVIRKQIEGLSRRYNVLEPGTLAVAVVFHNAQHNTLEVSRDNQNILPPCVSVLLDNCKTLTVEQPSAQMRVVDSIMATQILAKQMHVQSIKTHLGDGWLAGSGELRSQLLQQPGTFMSSSGASGSAHGTGTSGTISRNLIVLAQKSIVQEPCTKCEFLKSMMRMARKEFAGSEYWTPPPPMTCGGCGTVVT